MSVLIKPQHFEVALTRSDSQITRLLITPPPEAMNFTPSTQLAPIWMIKLGGTKGEEIVETAYHEYPVMALRPRESA